MKKKKITGEDLVLKDKITTALEKHQEITLSPEQEKQLEEKLPLWVKEIAENTDSVLRFAQEFLILVEELLRKDHGFSEGQLVHLETRLKEMLPELHKMSLEGLVILRPADMAAAVGMIDAIKMQIKAEKSKIALPNKNQIKKLS